MLWCSFWIWTRSSWMPFPLLFEAAVWPSVWPCSLVQAGSGMRLLFDWWSHGNQPRWASLDKPILCLHIPCVDVCTKVSSSRRLIPCSPPKVQSAPQWLCQTNITMSGHSWVCMMWCGKWKPSFRSVAIFQSLAAAINFCPCGLLTCRGGLLLLGGNWCMGVGLGWAACWPPYTGSQLTRLWRQVYILSCLVLLVDWQILIRGNTPMSGCLQRPLRRRAREPTLEWGNRVGLCYGGR